MDGYSVDTRSVGLYTYSLSDYVWWSEVLVISGCPAGTIILIPYRSVSCDNIGCPRVRSWEFRVHSQCPIHTKTPYL